MRKKKPFRVLEERRKCNYIIITVFKRRKIYSYGVSTSIGDGGIGHPENGAYRSCFEARNAALHHVLDYHRSPLQRALLSKFRLMEDIDQPLLFDDV